MASQFSLFPPPKRFTPDQVRITEAALDRLDPIDALKALGRHGSGDWGNVSATTAAENEGALRYGWPLHSIYTDRHGTEFWIVTAGDYSLTLILLPDDY